MIIKRYPSVNNDRDARIAPKRGGSPKFGTFGAVVAVYRLAFESEVQADVDGKIYFPVDSAEEAKHLIEKLSKKGLDDYIVPRPFYDRVYFIPNGVH